MMWFGYEVGTDRRPTFPWRTLTEPFRMTYQVSAFSPSLNTAVMVTCQNAVVSLCVQLYQMSTNCCVVSLCVQLYQLSTNCYVVSLCVQLYQMSKIRSTYQTVPDWSEFQLEYIQQASISAGWYNNTII